ncbi:MAG: hypothetical protein KF832_12980 [Caldilineaceae bacterium]|nr:hypothetical protein [Caldilineaceae bacterium]
MKWDIERRQAWLFPWLPLLFVTLSLGFALFGQGQAVRAAGETEWKGWVEAMPSGGLMGEWTIGGRRFVTDSNTRFDTDKGAFAMGRCVEVEYRGAAAPFAATKLATKHADDCSTVTGTPAATATATASPATTTPNATGTPAATPSLLPTGVDDDSEARGLIERLPTTGLFGSWTIGGVVYAITAATRLRQDDAPFVMGACAEVEYQTGTTPRLALRLETKRSRDCQAPTPTAVGTLSPVGTPAVTTTPNRTPDDDDEIYGLVQQLPAGLVGQWVIGGQSYLATAQTEFDEEHGALAVGVCVKAHLLRDGVTLREVETGRGFRCGGSDGSGANAAGELYGVIQSFPATLIGDWNIGGITVLADGATEFAQQRGAFAVGVTVKVHFFVLADGTFAAREIETKLPRDNQSGDDDSHPGREGHAFGTIEELPANQVGVWQISGIRYTVDVTTTLLPTASNLGVGAQVRVKYYLDAAQQRVARLIKLSNEERGADDQNHATLYGYVEQMPPSGFVGEWLVGGTGFLATNTTKFHETDGLLGLGAYVKMEYLVQDGQNRLHEIEVAVPPGAGDDSQVGVLEVNGNGLQAASVQATAWVIAGTTYYVTPATDLNESQGALQPGQTVLVNSYTTTDGSRVATQIHRVVLAHAIYLPFLRN